MYLPASPADVKDDVVQPLKGEQVQKCAFTKNDLPDFRFQNAESVNKF